LLKKLKLFKDLLAVRFTGSANYFKTDFCSIWFLYSRIMPFSSTDISN